MPVCFLEEKGEGVNRVNEGGIGIGMNGGIGLTKTCILIIDQEIKI